MLNTLYDYKKKYEEELLFAKAKVEVVNDMINGEIRKKNDETVEYPTETEVAEQPTDESY